MANPFLNKTDLVDRDVETALMLEKAIVHDIGNAVAYTDGTQIFINTEDNLNNILPAYDQRMLKWLLWHERMHLELKHHNRFFKYLEELSEEDTEDEFQVTKEEVNIIMDILVHDWMSSKFPELVETAVNNLAQFRDRNSLKYTFKHYTLEEMLDEYRKFKHKDEDKKEGEGKGEEKDSEEDKDSKSKGKSKGKAKDEDKSKEDKSESTAEEKGHAEGGASSSSKEDEFKDDEAPEIKDASKQSKPGHHDETDWSKLDNIDNKEFITEEESDEIKSAIDRLKRKKFKIAKITETLNGLVTSTRKRSYTMPSTTYCGKGIILKGSTPGRTRLYLIFDASGSMSRQLATFKEIISKSIPQAMDMPCEWFAGYNALIKPYKIEHKDGYYKGKFKDIMPVQADCGYNDDGDRTIELCWQAEQLGYSPIGVTDGGGQISWSKDKLKQLKRTVLVGQNPHWLEEAKKINPMLQVIDI